MQVVNGRTGEVHDDVGQTSKNMSPARRSKPVRVVPVRDPKPLGHGAYGGGKKTKSLAIRLEPELYDAFQAAVKERREPSMTRVIEDYMVWYVNNPPGIRP